MTRNARSTNRVFILLCLAVAGTALVLSSWIGRAPTPSAPEVHCKHFLYGYPAGTPATNDLIIRETYAASSNDETKFADWVAYRLDAATVAGEYETKRAYRADPWLGDEERLTESDYAMAFEKLKTDHGHQAPLASFSGVKSWADTNYHSNLTPQKSALNQGSWKILEQRVRTLVRTHGAVFVMTGPLYERRMPRLPATTKDHRVPSGYWKIVVPERLHASDPVTAASFIFDQDTPKGDPVIDHLCTIDEVEERSGLDFLHELPDDEEDRIERDMFRDWASRHFG